MRTYAFFAVSSLLALVACSPSPDDAASSSDSNWTSAPPGHQEQGEYGDEVACKGTGFTLGIPLLDPKQSAFQKPDQLGQWVLGGGDMPLEKGTIQYPGQAAPLPGRLDYVMFEVNGPPKLRVTITSGEYDVSSIVDVDLCAATASGATFDPIGMSDPIPLAGSCAPDGLRRIRDAFGFACP